MLTDQHVSSKIYLFAAVQAADKRTAKRLRGTRRFAAVQAADKGKVAQEWHTTLFAAVQAADKLSLRMRTERGGFAAVQAADKPHFHVLVFVKPVRRRAGG